MGKTIQGDARTIILKVLSFFEDEKKNNCISIPIDQAMKRTALATGVSIGTVLNIKKEAKKILAQNISSDQSSASCSSLSQTIVLPTPGKKRKSFRSKIHLDNTSLCALRNIIERLYEEENKVPTLNKTLAVAKKELNFPGGKKSLHQIVHNELGYDFTKPPNGKPLFKKEIKTESDSQPQCLTEDQNVMLIKIEPECII